MDRDRKEILVIEGSRSPDSLRSLPISVVIAEEVDSCVFGSVGDEVITQSTGFIDRDVEDHPTETIVSEPESYSSIPQQLNGKVWIVLNACILFFRRTKRD